MNNNFYRSGELRVHAYGSGGSGKSLFEKEYRKVLKKRRRRKMILNMVENIRGFLYRHRMGFLTLLGGVLLLGLCLWLRAYGVALRANGSIGGELLIFFIPFIFVIARDTINDLIDGKKRRK